MTRSDRGVSETLGFVFIFVLIISTTGFVYTFGIDGLRETRDAERLNNAERAFDVLATNMDDIRLRGAPSRATEIKLAESQLRIGEPVTLNVTGENPSDPNDNFTALYDIRPIVYTTNQGTDIAYVNGAVIRDGEDGDVMLDRPGFVLTSDRLLMPILQTREGGERTAVGGSTTVLVRADRPTSGGRESLVTSESTYEVTINMSTPRATVWRRELTRDRPAVDCSDPANNATFVSCDLTTDSAYITGTIVDVAFE